MCRRHQGKLADLCELALRALAQLVDARKTFPRNDDLLRGVRIVVVDVLPVPHLLALMIRFVVATGLGPSNSLSGHAPLLAAVRDARPRQQKQQKSST